VERATGVRLPDVMFHGAFLETISTLNFRALDDYLRDQLIAFVQEFLDCECRERPLCGCPERKFALTIIELREAGLDHRQISTHLLDEYGIDIFPADVLSFLEDSVHLLEAIQDVARLQGAEEIAKKTEEHIRKIEQ
jgi:superfamily II helicase